MIMLMNKECRRLLPAFYDGLNRPGPQPLDWQRLYASTRYSAPSAEEVGHVLVQNGLDRDEAEQFLLFYKRTVELLERQADENTQLGRHRLC
jgi:hypothetical protein